MAAKDYTGRMLGMGRRFGHGDVLVCMEMERQRKMETARINRVRNSQDNEFDERNRIVLGWLRK